MFPAVHQASSTTARHLVLLRFCNIFLDFVAIMGHSHSILTSTALSTPLRPRSFIASTRVDKRHASDARLICVLAASTIRSERRGRATVRCTDPQDGDQTQQAHLACRFRRRSLFSARLPLCRRICEPEEGARLPPRSDDRDLLTPRSECPSGEKPSPARRHPARHLLP